MQTEQLHEIYPGGLKAVDELDLEVHQGEKSSDCSDRTAPARTTTAGMLTTR